MKPTNYTFPITVACAIVWTVAAALSYPPAWTAYAWAWVAVGWAFAAWLGERS